MFAKTWCQLWVIRDHSKKMRLGGLPWGVGGGPGLIRKGNTIGSALYSVVHGERPALCCTRCGLEMGVGDCVGVVNVYSIAGS